jgi:cellobiose phosphorylase
MMKFGHFDDPAREYVITRPDTPLPWINYLGSEAYFGLFSNTAGGYSFYKDARLRRLTRFRYNNAPLDEGGRYLYLRDNAPDAGEPAYWSPSWMPTRTKLESYECRHGLGYSTIDSSFHGIRANTRYFVPLGENLEIWHVTLTNQRAARADLSLFSAIEFCLWDANDDATNYQRNYSTGQVEIEDGVIYHKTEYRERRNHFAYFACSERLAGFDTQRESFLGPYRGWNAPLVVENGQSTNSRAQGWQLIGSHHVKVSLDVGESKEIIFILGYHENPSDDKFEPSGSQIINKRGVNRTLTKYLNPENAVAAFTALAAYWTSLLDNFQVATPDSDVNRMVNIWNAYQCMVTFNMSRSASYFESGIGRGMGFRDSNQDLLGFVHMIPARARERILDLAATQFPNGGAFHQYQTFTKRGNHDIGSGFNDDPLWLVLGVTAYIKETGDVSILDEAVQFENQPGSESSLFEHLRRCIQYTLDRLGPHGLPLIGRADWNDCLNLNCFSETPGQSFQTTTNKDGLIAESVFIAGLFVLASNEMSALLEYWSGSKLDPQMYRNYAAEMEKVIWRSGWDGEWFRRAYDDFGRPIGSKENDEGQIFIEPQGLCVMAGLGLENGNAARALGAVRERLATEHGIILQQPAYSEYQLHLGEISSYPPGYKENAGIFCHTNPWIMIAEATLGHADMAFDYYKRINPSAREALGEVHKCEPYVYAQMIAGRDAATFGEAKNSWLTGTAAWNMVAITQYILGIQPTYYGLRIFPVIPSDWKGFAATRHFRGATYHIDVKRNGNGNHVTIQVNGRQIKGNLLPLASVGEKVEVKATLS